MTDQAESSPAPCTPGPDPGSASSPHRTIPTWRWALANFEEIVTAVLLAVMIGSIGVSVFCRYMLKLPLSWTEEVVLLCMVWMCFLGASVVAKHQEHIRIDFFIALAPRRLTKAMELICLVVITGVLVVLVWQGILLLEVTQDVTTIALGIPTMYMYAAIPVSALLMLIQNLRQLYAAFRQWV
ncbi:MAG TPA: TRAP transporter small permease [Candidatus Methylomirabilis sp.]|nr:TRAP transporter small permease [Candidatus Methylomirabilis sp.]